jgi:hypothetical protein
VDENNLHGSLAVRVKNNGENPLGGPAQLGGALLQREYGPFQLIGKMRSLVEDQRIIPIGRGTASGGPSSERSRQPTAQAQKAGKKGCFLDSRAKAAYARTLHPEADKWLRRTNP